MRLTQPLRQGRKKTHRYKPARPIFVSMKLFVGTEPAEPDRFLSRIFRGCAAVCFVWHAETGGMHLTMRRGSLGRIALRLATPFSKNRGLHVVGTPNILLALAFLYCCFALLW